MFPLSILFTLNYVYMRLISNNKTMKHNTRISVRQTIRRHFTKCIWMFDNPAIISFIADGS